MVQIPLGLPHSGMTSAWRRDLEKLICNQLTKKFPACYGTWTFIVVFMKVCQSLRSCIMCYFFVVSI